MNGRGTRCDAVLIPGSGNLLAHLTGWSRVLWFRHLWVRRDVEALLDDELDGARARRVRDHVSECWPCSGQVELTRLVRAALRRSHRDGPSSLTLRRLTKFSQDLPRA